jgi:hypothetical protein
MRLRNLFKSGNFNIIDLTPDRNQAEASVRQQAQLIGQLA